MEDQFELKAIALKQAIDHHASESHPRKPVPSAQIVKTAKQFLGFLVTAQANGSKKRN